jgi:hypothetical protein
LVFFGGLTEARASRHLRVQLDSCATWSEQDLERLVQLELGTVGGGESDVDSADVDIVCGTSNVTITARESSNRALSRTVDLLPAAEDSAHLLAISVAQLVRALDWLPEPSMPTPAAAPRPDTRPHTPPPQPRSRALELHLGAGPRARQFGGALNTYRVGVGSGLRLTRSVQLGAAASYEHGDASRAAGQVSADVLGAAVQVGYEPWRGPRWSGVMQLELGLRHLTLRGEPVRNSTKADQARGFGGEAQLGLGPILRWDGVGAALLAEAGATRFGGRGLVSGEQSVSLDGAWVGAELRLLWAP